MWDEIWNFTSDNWYDLANLGLGGYSMYNQYQAGEQAEDYMDQSMQSSQEYWDWWKNNMAPLQQARSINELYAMGFTQDDQGNWTLSDDVVGMYETGLGLTNQQLQMQQELLPEQRELYEQQLGLQGAQMEAAMGDIELYNQNRGMEQAYYDQAEVDPQAWADKAATDVKKSYKNQAGSLRRDASRMGLNPNSGAFGDKLEEGSLDMARDVGFARTSGRHAGETERYNRMGQAMNVRQRLGPATPSVSMPMGLTPQGGMASSGAQLPSSTYMQGAGMLNQSAQGYGQTSGYFLDQGLSGLGSGTSNNNGSPSAYIEGVMGYQPAAKQATAMPWTGLG